MFFLAKFLTKLNFDFLLHNFSRYVIFDFFARKVLGDIGLDKESVTYERTDGRLYTQTDVHTRREKQYMSHAGGDI